MQIKMVPKTVMLAECFLRKHTKLDSQQSQAGHWGNVKHANLRNSGDATKQSGRHIFLHMYPYPFALNVNFDREKKRTAVIKMGTVKRVTFQLIL